MEWIGYESVLIVFTPALCLFLINYIYQNIRRRFSYRVNCWFCNENTRVPHAEINAFVCPSCTQYNGFNKDGGYNKQIFEQHDEMLNAQYHSSSINENYTDLISSNGLCKFCNNNQQLKIYQLAHFVPLDEENYDIEIEHFQKQLEKAYKLCPKCDRVLKKTLGQQNKWMLGLKLASLKKKVAVINETIVSVQAGSRHWLLTGFLRLLLLFYFLAVIMVTSKHSKQLSEYVPEFVKLLNYNWIIEYGNINYFGDNYIPVLAITGILLSVTLFMTNRKSKINKKTEVPLSPKKLCKIAKTEQEETTDFPLNSTDLSSDPESDYESFNASMRKRQIMKKKAKKHNTNLLKPLIKNSMYVQKLPQTTFENINRSKSPSNSSTFNLPELFAEVRSPASVFSVKPQQTTFDLNLSLGNLKLSPKRPILSPAKMKNPWASGGPTSVASGHSFWETKPNLSVSRSSSQSSGFISNCPEPVPFSRCDSICGDFGSLYSEPVNNFNAKNMFLFSQRREFGKF